MSKCEKQQKVVRRGANGSETRLRCMNPKSGFHAQEVTDDIWSRCPVMVLKHKRPCHENSVTEPHNDGPPITTEELINVTDEEVKAMIEDAGLELEPTGHSELPPDYPPMSMQMWTYKEALLRWAKAGRPTRTQEEVEEIHSTFCKPCEWYDAEQMRCRGCGCKVTTGGLAVLNKLKMKTEKCPKGNF